MSRVVRKWNFLGKRHEAVPMKHSRFTEAQIMAVLRQAEGGSAVSELCRKHGISSATFYRWRAVCRDTSGRTRGTSGTTGGTSGSPANWN